MPVAERAIDVLESGMVLAGDVKTGDRILVKSGFVITEKLIEKLKGFGVTSVQIEVDKEDPPPPPKSPVRLMDYNTGEFICLQGSPSTDIYNLISGKLGVLIIDSGEDADPVLIREKGRQIAVIEGKGTNFGEIGAIMGQSRTASILALEPSKVALISARGGALEGTIINKPELGLSLAVTLAKRFKETNSRLSRMDSLRKQIASRLAFYSKAYLHLCDLMASYLSEHRNEREISEIFEEAKRSKLYIMGRQYAASEIQQEAPSAKTEPSLPSFNTGDIVDYDRDAVICNEGEEGRVMFILNIGRLGVFIGDKRVATIDRKGAIIGEMAVLLGHASGNYEKRTATIKAISDSQLIAIPAEELQMRIKKDPGVMLHITKSLAERLPATNTSLIAVEEEIQSLMKRFECENEFNKLSDLFSESPAAMEKLADVAKLCKVLPFKLLDEINSFKKTITEK